MGKFFIERPIFAWVISIIIMLAGIGSITSLPVAQYPDIAPPTIKISTTYTGASAETVENSVTQILEQQLTGLDGLLYFSSSSSSSGQASIDVSFKQGTNADTAQVQVQNKISQATTRLPSAVQKYGVNVTKSQSDMLMILALYDETDKSTATDISDYMVSNMQDAIARVDGVGSIRVFGSQYAMRIWLDPSKLLAYKLNPSDISNAILAQNVQVSAGKIGAMPTLNNQQLNATVTAESKLQTPEEFRNIIVKHSSDGALVRLSDVARVELGSESYDNVPRLNAHPASGLAVMLAPDANALSTAERVRAVVEKMQSSMPQGYKVAYPKDSTKFIKISISEVVKTLFEAIGLVVIIMFIFLQNWRATLIPAIAVPVVLLGTFGILYVFGYSINTLTMFAMVLSIGLLVDDAIVVVENVERIMREQHLDAHQATVKSMDEVSSALIGIATVLSAVFLPMAFFEGSTGVIYRQFSITIVSSMILSVVVALTLTPALCATLLNHVSQTHSNKGFFKWFNKSFDIMTKRYEKRVLLVLDKPTRWMIIYVVIIAVMSILVLRLPTGFLPVEDQGSIMVQISLPEGASVKRTVAVAKDIEKYFLNNESNTTDTIFTISGFNFSGSGQNAGMAFVNLKDWDERKDAGNSAGEIVSRVNKTLSSTRDAQIFALNPPAIRGLGNSNGFDFQLQANAGTNRDTLKTMRDQLLGEASKDTMLSAVRLGSMSETSQLHVNIDQAKAVALGLSLSDIDDTLSAAWAGNYINDFIDRGRVKKVYMQGDAAFRSAPEDLFKWYVRGSDGESMTPFSAFATTNWTYGPESLSRYNGLASYSIQGAGSKGVGSGAAMDEMVKLTQKLPVGSSYSWSGLSYQEQLSSGQSTFLYAISILFVFLCLAALYESWSIPFSVLMVIPLGIIGAVIAASVRGLENDVYFQVALLTVIGLSSKNAILIVEFASTAFERGRSLHEAAMEGAKLRLRPILMTSMAFVVGVLPLAISTGAGAKSRISIGSGIVGGTLSATFLAIVMVPLFFVLVNTIFKTKANRKNLPTDNINGD
ncbi:MAG: efflux RND transporter permease subunit [Sulfurovaceae bacterium]|nr:efflux RND transporter permease subunit [Sulfurovaceae bacterium]MDD5548309.1 efflux RND transporter permease subunit [Sulfurovaceae bacterium]